MSETTSSKKRLAITITSMCVAVVAVICSIVAIFAATSQTVTTQFKVTYSATNVAATVAAEYKLKTATAPVSLGSAEIEATAGETTYNTLSTSKEIDLTTTDTYVIFRYAFTNDSTSKAFNVTLTDGALKENVTLQYAVSHLTGEYPAEDDSAWTSDVPSNVRVEVSTSETVKTTVYIFIKAEITNLANNANYESTGSSLISWALAAV